MTYRFHHVHLICKDLEGMINFFTEALDATLVVRKKFGTADGRGVLHCHRLPDLKGTENNHLRLMTVRSEGQFNTVVYEEEDLYRNQERRDLILIHPDDLKRFGLHNDQRVTVKSETGVMSGILARSYDSIRSGNALMYYPESNVLVARHADPQSRTPAFKGVVVELIAE